MSDAWFRGALAPMLKKGWEHAEIISVPPQKKLDVICLGREPWGTYFHHIDRSELCYGADQCDHCAKQIPRRWRGYMPAQLPGRDQPYILHVTQACAWVMSQFFIGPEGAAGKLMEFYRGGSKKNSKLYFSRVRKDHGLALMPLFDPRPQVLLVHGWSVEAINRLIDEPSYEMPECLLPRR